MRGGALKHGGTFRPQGNGPEGRLYCGGAQESHERGDPRAPGLRELHMGVLGPGVAWEMSQALDGSALQLGDKRERFGELGR